MIEPLRILKCSVLNQVFPHYFRAHITFTNLFNGNVQLGDALNKFINDNWKDIINDLKPAMAESLGAIYKSLLDNMFSNIPYDEFFEK